MTTPLRGQLFGRFSIGTLFKFVAKLKMAEMLSKR